MCEEESGKKEESPREIDVTAITKGVDNINHSRGSREKMGGAVMKCLVSNCDRINGNE